MKRFALGLVAVGTAAAVAVPLTSAGAQAPGPRTIDLVERQRGSQFGFVDNPPKIRNRNRAILSPGDTFVFSAPLFDESNQTRRGKLHVQCAVTTRGRENRVDQLCTGVFALDDGQLSISTAFRGNPSVITGIVTGGDGAYAGARGTFRSENRARGNNRDTITLLG